MLPRNSADYRTLLWAVLMPAVLIVQYARPNLVWYLWPLSMYFAMAAGTMAHNQNHCPTFKNRRMNALYASWLSIWYGYPSFAWVPTHNLNHHKHVNRAGDATITWRHTNRNTWWIAVSYFFVSAWFQSTPIKEYIRKSKTNNTKLHKQIVNQYVVWIGFLVVTLVAAFALYNWKVALPLWILTVGVPTLFGPWCMMWFNYMQHVHCDPWSEHNHSRNITGRVFNFLVFNNGLHTVHHENPGSHWSKAYGLHDAIKSQIDPRLNEWSFWGWVIRAYVITAAVPRWETKQIGRAPFDPPNGEKVVMAEKGPLTDSVDALEAGNNAQMA